jgi:hypothetical protein
MLLFALLGGVGCFVLHFAAELLIFAVLRGTFLASVWGCIRFELAYRGWRRRASRLREVPPPPRHDNICWYH